MRIRIIPFLLALFASASAVAQPQVYNFKELQPFLPAGDFGAYKPGSPGGETSSMMGFSTSWAQVVYSLDTSGVTSTISVKITDMLSIPTYLSLFNDVDKETATGYEKTVIYRTMRILETYDASSRDGKLQFPVAKRFLVEVTGKGIESTAPLYEMLDKMDLEGLAALAHPSQTP